MNSQQGRKYVILFYKHAPELTSIMLMNNAIAVQSREVINFMLPDVESALQNRDVTLSAMQRGRIIAVLDAIDKKAGPALQMDLRQLKQDFKSGAVLSVFNGK